jgi:ribosome-binding protein aMBF1 (putative translation factor)
MKVSLLDMHLLSFDEICMLSHKDPSIDIKKLRDIRSYQVMKLNRIKTVLSEKGISQTWLAKQLDKSFSMVNAYACNRIQPNLETLQRIAEILQVDLKDLITDKKERLQ